MSFNPEDTYRLIRLVEQRKKPIMFFASRYFGQVMTFDTEEIHFDYLSRNRRLAPYVSPLVAGKVMSGRGHSMKSFRPAYLKPKHVLDLKGATKRRPGEPFGGMMSVADRRQLAKMENYMLEAEMIDNRIELMCYEAMKTGKIVVAGDDYPTQEVDFGRDAGLTITLTGTDIWTDAGSDPMGDIEDMGTAMANAAYGAAYSEITMDPDAWKAFRAHADTKDHLDKNIVGNNLLVDRGPTPENDDVQLVGSMNGGATLIWRDSRTYEDAAGNIQKVMASGDVVFASRSMEGVQAFGAILDDDFLENDGRVEATIYPKSWKVPDPSATYTMTQSAPLPVPVRANACGFMNVLGN